MKADPIFLTLSQVLAIHDYNIRTSGGENGVKDVGLVESAVAAPQATFGGEFLYRTIPEMASAY